MGCSLRLPRPVVPFPLGMGSSALSPGDPQSPGAALQSQGRPAQDRSFVLQQPLAGELPCPAALGFFWPVRAG